MRLVFRSLAAFAAVAFLSLSTAEAGPIRFRGRGADQGSPGRFAFAGETFGVHSRRIREGSFGARQTAFWLDGVQQAFDAAKASQALLRNGHQSTGTYLSPILRPHLDTPWDEQPDEPMHEQLDRELDGQPTPEPFADPDPDPAQSPPGPEIDGDIDFTPNPEPATLLLFGAGAAAGAAYRRRRRRREAR